MKDYLQRINTQKSDIMKATVIMIIAVFFFWNLEGSKVYGQTVAIGHVSAEVVEAVSVSSLAVTDFNINNASTLAINQSSASEYNYESVNLGSIKINSGKDVACNLVMKSAELSDMNGNGLSIEPSALSADNSDFQRAIGNQTLQVNGKARIAQGQASGLYQGSYTMVFAYN